MKKFVHHTAILDKNVRIGKNSKIWHWTHLSENVKIGENCVLGQNVFIGKNVKTHRMSKSKTMFLFMRVLY